MGRGRWRRVPVTKRFEHRAGDALRLLPNLEGPNRTSSDPDREPGDGEERGEGEEDRDEFRLDQLPREDTAQPKSPGEHEEQENRTPGSAPRPTQPSEA